MREVALGEVISPTKDPVRLVDDTEYPTVGILSYGRGLFERPIVRGDEVSYSTYFRIAADQFVYSKLFAWEGALTVVPGHLDGYFVSQEFPTFDVDRSRAMPEYLRLLTTWPELWERVREGESGMGGRRKRVHPDKLLAVAIPLPELQGQARVVDLVNACDSAVEQTASLVRASQSGWRALADELIGALERRHSLESASNVTMGRQRSPKDASGTHMVRYLRAANVKDGRLELDDVMEMNFTPVEQTTFMLRFGDVLVTEGCGSLGQLGASAIWDKSGDEVVCFQNTLFRLRAIEGTTTPGFLHHLARYSHRAGWWATIASGTNIFHIGSERAKAMPVPLPTLAEQERITSVLDAADELGRRAAAQLAASKEARSRLFDDLLTGAHEIPASYDAVLDRAS